MHYIFNADIYCEACGHATSCELDDKGIKDNGDSDTYPQTAAEEPTDSPQHCASYGYCLAPIDLGDYGLAPDAPLYGAEMRTIGALCGDELTDEGMRYLQEMLNEPDPTPYQTALYNLWRETYEV